MRIGSLAVSAPGMKAMDNLEDYNKATRPRLDLVTPITRYEEHAAHDAHATMKHQHRNKRGESPHSLMASPTRIRTGNSLRLDSATPNEAEGNTDYI